jgi:hypothetical protein
MALVGAVAAPLISSAFGGGSSPPNVQTSGTQQTQLPPWYTAYLQGALGTGESLASQPFPQYGGQRTAGFTDPQMQAFSNINQAQGNWAPALQGGLSAASTAPQIAGNAAQLGNYYGANATGIAGNTAQLGNQYGMGALGAASRPIQQWSDPGVADQWMSPYMRNVTDAIAQQGNQNWQTNLMPGIESQFIAAGNPNSSANAAALGLGASQTQANISALQSQALQQGYQNAMQGFQTGQGQQLQQSGLAANTGLGAGGLSAQLGQLGTQSSLGAGGLAQALGQLGVQGGLGAASALTGGAQAGQGMTYNDIQQMLNMGGMQQGLAQTGYNTAYQNFMNQVQWPWQQLSNLSGIASGAQLPTSTSATGNAPLAGATYGASPLALAGAGATLGSSPGVQNWFSGLFGGNTNATPNTSPGLSYTGGGTTFTGGGNYTPGIDIAPTQAQAGGGLRPAMGAMTSAPSAGGFTGKRGGLVRASHALLPAENDETFSGPLAAASYGAR